jgi:hypothetical protein
MSLAASQKLAEDTIEKHPIAMAYGKARNGYEEMWAMDNFADAARLLDEQSKLPEHDRTFNPSKPVRNYIEIKRQQAGAAR